MELELDGKLMIDLELDVSEVEICKKIYNSPLLTKKKTKGFVSLNRESFIIWLKPNKKGGRKLIRVGLSKKALDLAETNLSATDVMDRAMQHLQDSLPHVIIKGYKNAPNSIISIDQSGRHTLQIEGTCLQDVLATEGVVATQTRSNHIIEVEQVLGIEAARKSIMSELLEVMNKYGIQIDRGHLMLLADTMTSRGKTLAITRSGIQKMRESVLTLASFERQSPILFQAALNRATDLMVGVSEPIITGYPVRVGTGMLQLHRRDFTKSTGARAVRPISRQPLLFGETSTENMKGSL